MDENNDHEADVVDNFEEERRRMALRRRSSLANSIRRSQSIVGISFEDQISALDTSTPIPDRLAQVFNLALSATCRALQTKHEEGDDEHLASLVEHVRTSLIKRGPVLVKDDPVVGKLSEKVSIMSGLVEEASAPLKVLPPRLKNLQEYLGQVKEESSQWKDLHLARKNRQTSSRTHLKMVIKGEKVVDESTRADLPRAEDAGLRSASDGRLELERLRQQTSKLVIAREHLKLQLVQRRQRIEVMSGEVDRAAKLICKESSALHKVDLQRDVPRLLNPFNLQHDSTPMET